MEPRSLPITIAGIPLKGIVSWDRKKGTHQSSCFLFAIPYIRLDPSNALV
jgi:hypothetical protein